jgi:hypothetical protein
MGRATIPFKERESEERESEDNSPLRKASKLCSEFRSSALPVLYGAYIDFPRVHKLNAAKPPANLGRGDLLIHNADAKGTRASFGSSVHMNRGASILSLVFGTWLLAALAGCGSSTLANGGGGGGATGGGGTGGGGNGNASSSTPLSAGNVNLIFVVSEDLAYNASGDINPETANLTSQGLQRSLLMAKFLHNQVLGTNNASAIYALEPMTHLQTANNDPDMVALWTIQHFALLNQVTLSTAAGSYASPYAAYSYPINASYAPGSAPGDVITPSSICPPCQGVDFNDAGGDNEALASAIIKANAPGFYVFSGPWETVSSMLAKINSMEGGSFTAPANYLGPNIVFAVSITTAGSASLVSYNTGMQPSSTYPALPATVSTNNSCSAQAPFSIMATAGNGGATVPAGTNTNETLYLIRHAEAHPEGAWDDGNYVGAGQWRALALPAALQGKISPTLVYSIDPAQFIGGTQTAGGNANWSYVRPALTVEPYAIANNLPFKLAANFEIFATAQAASTSNFFFKGGQFSNQKVLLAWEHTRIPDLVNALIADYFPSGSAPAAPAWPDGDYDTIWTVTLDGQGNLTVDNSACEGIESSALPATAPQF